MIESTSQKSNDFQSLPKVEAGFQSRGWVSFTNLKVKTFGTSDGIPPTFAWYPFTLFASVWKAFKPRALRKVALQGLDGLVTGGEMLLVLGVPESGCSTFLKTIAGLRVNLNLDECSSLKCGGIPDQSTRSYFSGASVYCANNDTHFSELSVSQTLSFANGCTKVAGNTPVAATTETLLETFRLNTCSNTKIGSDTKRGVSGGERRRVTLAEVWASPARVKCWDSCTSGLDSNTALHFIKMLYQSTRTYDTITIATMYQTSEPIYELFDKVMVLNGGHLIYFGPTADAVPYFEALGHIRPESSTSAEFLTSLSGSHEKAKQLVEAWNSSTEKRCLQNRIQQQGSLQRESTRAVLHNHAYILSFSSQLRQCLRRASQRSKGNLGATIGMAVGNMILSLIIGSVFYDLQENADSIFRRSVLLFYITTVNSFLSAAEVQLLWEHRPIIEKHRAYGFYHPIMESISSILCDLPGKLFYALAFNVPVYFLSNLRRTFDSFIVFFIFSFACLLTLSMLFRMAGSFSRSIVQSIVPVGVLTTVFVIYSGFILPVTSMQPWLSWIRFVNPLYYAFESVMLNEFNGLMFPCRSFIPNGPDYDMEDDRYRSCLVGIVGHNGTMVDGLAYLQQTYGFERKHMWRNLGILIAMQVVFLVGHLTAAKRKTSPFSEPINLRANNQNIARKKNTEATHDSPGPALLQPSTNLQHGDVFRPVLHWHNIEYRVGKGKNERIVLKGISGYICRGEVTAIMGVTGAGKTSLLNALAGRTVGTVSGTILLDGKCLEKNFQRLIGYAQQQDLHLPTSTVREALVFSAKLRGGRKRLLKNVESVVEEVLDLLELHDYANSIIGVLGEGLSIQQRRRLTFAIEMVTQPEVLLLDEPTTGLDSQSAQSILSLLPRLALHGQAVLCTIHQPSYSLLKHFDRLLLLDCSGQQLYFGPFGRDCRPIIDHFKSAGARPPRADENPAEWMLDVTNSEPTSTKKMMVDSWIMSDESAKLAVMLEVTASYSSAQHIETDGAMYATSFLTQYFVLMERTLTELWRSPAYVWSKLLLCTGVALSIGISLWMSPTSLQGVQSQLFSIFLILTIANSGMKQIIQTFHARRALFEAREHPSRLYSWKAFMLASITVEIPSQTLAAACAFILWYLPTGLYRHSSGQPSSERGGMLFLLLWIYFVLTSTFAHMISASIATAQAASSVAVILYQLMLLFCGVLAPPTYLPRFWIFMYRVSPLNYLVGSMMSAGIGNIAVHCSRDETVKLLSPPGTRCGTYLMNYFKNHRGYVVDAAASNHCEICPWSSTDEYLAEVGIEVSRRWQSFGILAAFIAFNVIASFFLYWIARVPKSHPRWK